MATVLPIILLDGVVPVAQDFMANFQALAAAIDAIGGGAALGSANQLAGVNASGTAVDYKTVNGTTNQLAVAHAAGSLTLALTAVVAVATAMAAGTNPASVGAFRLANDGTIQWRNAANSADIRGLAKDASDRIVLGPGTAENIVVGGQLRCDLLTSSRLVLKVMADGWAV